ncbi:hypothetical protein [Paraburkholderia rhizosphaerae]|uniref:Uncharacterized protein n=1 Tax=Paraburkholderia rhizosphaerae TaxID=480658 RepID=A0A4V3HFA6_9BURK|nr:hypothetical protein [Paraburkholderia rhizosphaerae]TDY52165.1 hypothetical protein BX592_10549 [Paraburkholderia rhizosphaerae]
MEQALNAGKNGTCLSGSSSAPITMKRNALLPLVAIASVGILSGCASSSRQTAAIYHPETEARVRVYWGATTEFFFNTNCIPKRNAKRITVSQPGLSSLTNKTVGMPVPPDAYRYFHEYIVPAEQPLTVRARIVSVTEMGNWEYVKKFQQEASTFVPQHGHDYEIVVKPIEGRSQIFARELVTSDTEVSAKQFDIPPARSCE